MLNNQARILILEDEPRWIRAISSLLTRSGYKVEQADSISVAKDLVNQRLFHMIICDIRLIDSDPNNADGIQLLEWLAAQNYLGGLAVIMLTAYSTREMIRRSFREFGVVDFLEKENFDGDTFLSKIGEIFSESLHRNTMLSVEYGQHLSIHKVARKLCSTTELAKYASERLEEEFTDLLMRLFPEVTIIVLSRQSIVNLESICIRVDLYYALGEHLTRILQVGPWPTIERSYKETSEYFQQLDPLQIRRTPLLGGIVYSLPSLAAFGLYQQELENFKEMKQNNKRLDQLLTIAVHELRAPLTRIKAILEDILKDKKSGQLTEDQRDFLTDARDQAEHELVLIGKMLDLTQLETALQLSLQHHDLINCIESALKAILPERQLKSLSLKQNTPEEGIEIECDPKWITQALYNILHNAVKFTETGGISVDCYQQGDHIYVQISDTGIGIQPEYLNKIFEYRFRINSDFEGWGVGLYSTKKIVERHAGKIQTESTFGKGTSIRVILPVQQSNK